MLNCKENNLVLYDMKKWKVESGKRILRKSEHLWCETRVSEGNIERQPAGRSEKLARETAKSKKRILRRAKTRSDDCRTDDNPEEMRGQEVAAIVEQNSRGLFCPSGRK